ncbi:hypothetical protein CC1G_03075 [Coprinopsis cinerea okayama7|uniref:BTB domain-containing protein n=1 Tax=Coprinopsis cinerea (strain Okayama-7 / 130 / ATCC MYA-4618 / FGSC 9003) TaxID=240176 RepID=A8PEU3_COPC7|nr:hypothetical protein CC1G_03075 [Coprinopsis cinerea okayama7\|eukprot:XP_001840846.1 hypothetical protein CC1G_03075 [Coprinopsis cinerea okayama7\
MDTQVPRISQVEDTKEDSELKEEVETCDIDMEMSTKRSDVWYDDGNIILQVEKTLFKVHKSVLSEQSYYFEELFSKPQPFPTPENTGEGGCPILNVSDDELDYTVQWTKCLRTIYNTRRDLNPNTTYPFALVHAMLVLGDKYGFHYLHKEAVNLYERTFPSDYDSFCDLGTTSEFESDYFVLNEQWTIHDIVKTAVEFGLERCLPAIFYLTLTHRDSENFLFGPITPAIGEPTRFDNDILEILVKGREKIYHSMARNNFAWLWSNPHSVPAGTSKCQKYKQCKLALERLLKKYWLPVPAIENALCPWRDSFGKGLCDSCYKAAQRQFESGQKALWKELPTLFGYPPWDELKSSRVEKEEDEDDSPDGEVAGGSDAIMAITKRYLR